MSVKAWPSAGELNRRIAIYRWSEEPTGFEDLTPHYAAKIECWAKKMPVAGLRYWGTQQVSEAATHIFWVRWQMVKADEITAQHVIEHDGHRYRVLSSSNQNDAYWYTLVETKALGAV